jgi:hypothetical protein
MPVYDRDRQQVPVNLRIWKCKNCFIQLGTLNVECTELQMKYKDLFVFFHGGTVRTICRKCGTENTLKDDGKPGALASEVQTKSDLQLKSSAVAPATWKA